MRKYLTVFQISWSSEFIYRLNFFLWRFRNILRLLMTYFLWRGVFTSNVAVFGYTQSQMFTYVFLVLLVQTIVFSNPSADHMGGEIGSGDLSNYLVKPVSYITYWFTRDLASKLLNLVFATFEIALLWYFLRPSITSLPDLPTSLAFMFSLSSAVLIYYFLNLATKCVSFWTPESTWGLTFLMLILIEILAGGIFPIDMLPRPVYFLLQLTPFPYLLYFPLTIFLGKLTNLDLLRVLVQSSLWTLIMYLLTRYLWRSGLRAYSSEGR